MKKEVKIPDSLDERGYTSKELKQICELFNIKEKKFNKALGVNTCVVDENGNCLIYKCDVENTLNYISNGKYLFFD